uniref:Reverse transcriptase domain-containing protein n=1 Tax=Oryzias sinensis TaxID=183150 RepID=A0A8C7Z7X7_9TELE
MDFQQHVTQPTHNRGHTLDLVITYGLSTGVSSVVDLAISDHYCVFFNVTSQIQQEASVRTVRKRYLTPEVAASFIDLFKQTPAQILPAPCDFIVDHFNNRLQSSIDAVAPFKTKTLRTTPKMPWKTDDIKGLKQNCRRAERKYRRTNLIINHKDNLKEQLQIYNNSVKWARTSYFSKIISENKNNPKFLFKTIDILINTDFNKSSMPSSNAACEDFADHFMGKIDAIRSNISSMQNTDLNRPPALYLPEETLESFVLVDGEMLGRVVSQVNTTTCLLDPIPTSLFKTFYGFFESELLNIVNCSLQMRVFPSSCKTAVVRPLLKKSQLDPKNLENYRPVSNLPFLSKITEKRVATQLHEFLNAHNILEKYQSGFRTNHSTETALLKIVNDLRLNYDSQKLSVLGLLDLITAFDTVDHQILLDRLRSLVGLSGNVLKWFYSYLTDRHFYVSMDTCSSKIHEISCGVPQRSILGPILFNLYLLPLGEVIAVDFHIYADDTQLYIAVSPDDLEPINTLLNCILDIKSWMAENFLQLNQDKTEVLIINKVLR